MVKKIFKAAYDWWLTQRCEGVSLRYPITKKESEVLNDAVKASGIDPEDYESFWGILDGEISEKISLFKRCTIYVVCQGIGSPVYFYQEILDPGATAR